MRAKDRIRCIAAGIFAAIYLTGCSQSGTAPESGAAQESSVPAAAAEKEGAGGTQAQKEEVSGKETGQQAESSSTSAENTESASGEGVPDQAQSDVDRYQEIMDRSGDDGKMIFYFLDLEVGEDAKDKSGDSTVIISPDGKVMLLDAGHTDSGEIVVQALKDLGIEKIDYLVASHPHIDHIGGVPEVMSNFPVGIAYRSCVEYTTQTYHNYVNALEEGGIEVVYLKTGDEFDFGDQVHVEVLGPGEDIVYPEGFPDNSTQFLNNNSLLLKFTYGEATALFGGDLYVSQERDYIEQYGDELKVDLAKANHHGKDTSNLKKWIKTVSPRVVVAMGDELGSMDVYENYVKQGAEYHHTVNDGVVKVIMDDKGQCQVIDQKDSWMN